MHVKQPSSRLRRMLIVMAIASIAWVLVNDRVEPLWNLRFAYIAMYFTVLSGMVLLVGYTGQVSLGQGAFMAVGGYTVAVALLRGVPLPIAFLLVVIVSILFGALVGVVGARLTGPYLAGLTLGLAVGLPALANRFPELLGSDSGLLLDGPYPPESFGFEFPVERWQAWIAGAVAILVGVTMAALLASPAGRSMRAVRDHEVGAALTGINPSQAKVLAFIVSSVCAGLGGAVLTSILGLAAPGAFGIGLSLSLLVGVIVGGRLSLSGALHGAILMALLPEILSTVVESWALPEPVSVNLAAFVYGCLLLLTVGFAPQGIAGLIHSKRSRHLP